MAGQAISISGIFAVLTSLVVSGVTALLDRRSVLLALTRLMILSGTLVAVAPDYGVLMLGRALLGVSIGGRARGWGWQRYRDARSAAREIAEHVNVRGRTT